MMLRPVSRLVPKRCAGTTLPCGRPGGVTARVPPARLPGARAAPRCRQCPHSFADEYGIPRRYSSYKELANDPDLDAIYVCTPHPFHCENSILCLEAGKAVLCEKPLTINAKEARKVIEYARAKRVFLMEAMWTRFLPVYTNIRQWLNSGAIGDISMLKADFGYREAWGFDDRHVNLLLGGGALLDIGVYTISLASLVFKEHPSRIESVSHIGETGVDQQAAMVFGYSKGQLAQLSCSMDTNMPHDAWIFGSKGSIYIPGFWRTTTATLRREGEKEEIVEIPFQATGYEYEAMEVMECVREGKLESEIAPLDESLEIIKIMDQIRAKWGLKYPGDDV